MAQKKKEKKKKKKNLKKNKMSFKALFYLLLSIVALVMFLPTTFLLAVGMLPTFVVAVVDNIPGKNRTFTVGAMNFAGCFPYLLGIWTGANSMESAVTYLSDPTTIIVIYGAAAVGYAINWVVTRCVDSLLIQASKNRLKKIDHEKSDLKKRWGSIVDGKTPLDEYGYPIENISVETAKAIEEVAETA